MGKDKIQEILNNFARATEVRPPCEARIDPDTCIACTKWTTESLEAGARLWGQARAPETIKALAAEVLRLRRIEDAVCADIAAEDAHNAANAAREAAWRNALAKDVDEMSAEGQRRHKAVGRAIKAWQKTARAAIAARAELRSVVLEGRR